MSSSEDPFSEFTDIETPLSRLAHFAGRYQKILSSISIDFLTQETKATQRNLLLVSVATALIINGQLAIKADDIKGPYNVTLGFSGNGLPEVFACLIIYLLFSYVVRIHTDWIQYSLTTEASNLLLKDLEEKFLPLPAQMPSPGESASAIQANMNKAWGEPELNVDVAEFQKLRLAEQKLEQSILNRDWLEKHVRRIRSNLFLRAIIDFIFPVLLGIYAAVTSIIQL